MGPVSVDYLLFVLFSSFNSDSSVPEGGEGSRIVHYVTACGECIPNSEFNR